MQKKGFILISMLFMLVLLSVTAITMNRRAALHSRMAANQISSIQTSLGQGAATQHAIWKLTKDPFWRTVAGGENYTYAGTTYNRKVLTSTVSGYTDAVTVSITAQGASNSSITSFRYYLKDIQYVVSPSQVFCDQWDDVYIADYGNHSIWKIDALTEDMTRVAGTGSSGYTGDGGAATSAELNQPRGVWVDNTGIIYIADEENGVIRKVDLAGNISTFAGTGSHGYDSDGIQATSAMLNHPEQIVGDNAGNIYISDRNNHRIRKVDASGIITTVAGNGSSGYTGDGTPATDYRLNYPRGIFLDSSGDLYIADRNNHRIRKLDTVGGGISTVAGNGTGGYFGDGGLPTSAQINYPRDVWYDESRDFIFIADTYNHRLRVFQEGAWISSIAGTGTAGYSGDGGISWLAQIDTPYAICVKSTGYLVIADNGNKCLREVTSSWIISTLTQTADPTYDDPRHITIDSNDNIYIADTDNHRIRKLDPSGRVTTVAGNGTQGYNPLHEGGAATDAWLDAPGSVAVDGSGNIYIADTGNDCIRKVDTSGNITTVAGICTSTGNEGDGGLATSAKLHDPWGVQVDSAGNFYIADYNNHCIRKVDTSGIINRVAGLLDDPGYSGDGGPATSAELRGPIDVEFDSSGNMYIADFGNECVRKVDTSNDISTFAGTCTQPGYSGDGGAATSALMNKPRGIFVDSNDHLYIGDSAEDVVRYVSVHDGNIYTLAGTGSPGYDPQTLPAVLSRFNYPSDVALSQTRGGRKIYICDRDNNRVRVLFFKIEKELY